MVANEWDLGELYVGVSTMFVKFNFFEKQKDLRTKESINKNKNRNCIFLTSPLLCLVQPDS